MADKKDAKVSENWTLAYFKSDIDRLGIITLRCKKCGGIPSVDIDLFKTLTPEKCQLEEGEIVHCNEPNCTNTLMSDCIVLAEAIKDKPICVSCCPVCGSTNIKKISTLNKAAALALLDLWAIGYVDKTFCCLDCKHKW